MLELGWFMNTFLDGVVELRKDLILQSRHFLPFTGCAMIHTCQVQYAMHEEHFEFGHHTQLSGVRLPFCRFERDEDITKVSLSTLWISEGVFEG